MCGIFCLICNKSDANGETTLLNEFGLFKEAISRRGPNSTTSKLLNLGNSSLLLSASVLWLQGAKLTPQPLETDNSLFLYNGDVFGGSQFNELLSHQKGDTQLIFDLLINSSEISETLSGLEGPYAFIFVDKTQTKLYFARDLYGRRSLLLGKHKTKTNLIIASVAQRNTEYEFIELPCIGVFSFDLNSNVLQLFPWRRRNKNFFQKIKDFESFLDQPIQWEPATFFATDKFEPPAESQRKMLKDLPTNPVGEIFQNYIKLHLDRITKLKNLLDESVKKRICKQPRFCQNCYGENDCQHCITGVLFSGGVDCAILALLANKFMEESRPIDLINVAFQKGESYDNTPDRKTGLETLKELQELCPQRKWNFVEVNVTRQELDLCRKQQISDLIYPLSSILDDSLGCALWFASRAATEVYKSPCRTLLVGMGADELFGGYTRHRAAFQQNSFLGLHDVLEEDWENLPHRNLARDDRVVSDHGRQLRTPYLDENVVKFVQSLNAWERTYPSKDLPQGIGDKILLRSLAYDLGLKSACYFKKRALQFGSRIANSKEKGHEISERLQAE